MCKAINGVLGRSLGSNRSIRGGSSEVRVHYRATGRDGSARAGKTTQTRKHGETMLSNIYCTIRASGFLGLGCYCSVSSRLGRMGNNTVGRCMIRMELFVFPSPSVSSSALLYFRRPLFLRSSYSPSFVESARDPGGRHRGCGDWWMRSLIQALWVVSRRGERGNDGRVAIL